MGRDLPAWFNKDRERINARSRKAELDVAKREPGGRRQAGSGSSYRAPQDVKSDTHLIQHKFTDKKSLSISASHWRKLRSDAYDSGREPAMIIEIDGITLRVTEDTDGTRRSQRQIHKGSVSGR